MTLPRQAQRGFTLIEIIVVVLIIGVVLALAVVRLEPGRNRLVGEEAERLALLFEAARDEAIASGAQIGWSTNGRRYVFWRRNGGDWQAVVDDSNLPSRELPEGIAIERIAVNLQPLQADGRLLFMPSGVNELFEMHLNGGEAMVKLSTDVLGRVKLDQEAVNAAGQ